MNEVTKAIEALKQARDKVEKILHFIEINFQGFGDIISVQVLSMRDLQQIPGEVLVKQDGTSYKVLNDVEFTLVN